jgi:ribosomal protein L32
MVPSNKGGRTPLDRLRHRFETTETKCPECGYADGEMDNWRSHTDGRQVVYHHVCPSCDAAREYVFHMDK